MGTLGRRSFLHLQDLRGSRTRSDGQDGWWFADLVLGGFWLTLHMRGTFWTARLPPGPVYSFWGGRVGEGRLERDLIRRGGVG